MYVQVEKPRKNKSRAVVNSVAQKKSNVVQGFGFVDNRPEALAQRKLQTVECNIPQVRKLEVNPSLAKKLKIVRDNPIIRKFGKPIDEMSRGELNTVIDDTELDESSRIEAEVELKNIDTRWQSRIKGLVAKGNYDGALEAATVVSEANLNNFKIYTTDDYSKVIPLGEEVPRGVPHGVTVKSNSGPVIYIHIKNIKLWVEEGDIGNLLSTIRHEAKHAEQQIENGPINQNSDAKEFEAYSEEIRTAYNLARRMEDMLLPTSEHIRESYERALEHHEKLSLFDSLKFIHRLSEMKEVYKKLYPYLLRNDKDSGRVGNMAITVKKLLKAYLTGKNKAFDKAEKMYMRIPAIFRNELKGEFDPLFDKAYEKSRNEFFK